MLTDGPRSACFLSFRQATLDRRYVTSSLVSVLFVERLVLMIHPTVRDPIEFEKKVSMSSSVECPGKQELASSLDIRQDADPLVCPRCHLL
jgi:hypothetical protein